MNDDLQNFFIAAQKYWEKYPIGQDNIEEYWKDFYNDSLSDLIINRNKNFVISCMRGSFYFMKEKYKIDRTVFSDTVFTL